MYKLSVVTNPVCELQCPPNIKALLSSIEVMVNTVHGGGMSPFTSGTLHLPVSDTQRYEHYNNVLYG